MSRILVLAVVLGAACSSNDPEPRSAPTIHSEVRHDTSAPLRDLATPPRHHTSWPVRAVPRPAQTALQTAAIQDQPVVAEAPSVLLSFDGIGQGFSGPAGTFSVDSAPPDPAGDVGPNHYMQMVNSDIAVFNKTGTALYGPVPTNTLWSGFGGLCETDNDGDGSVLYDPIADRWVASQFAVSGADGSGAPFLECVAISATPDPTGSWHRYAFGYTGFPDYPKLGVWPDAYYATFNMFNAAGTSFLGAKVCAYDRSAMLGGAAATQICFDTGTSFGGVLPADLDGARLPPAGAPEYLLALGAGANQLAFWKFHVDFTTPSSSTLTGPTTLATATFAEACGSTGTCIPQSGTTQKLDALSDRLMYRLAYRNFGDHEALVANHSVTAGSSVGVRWYELRLASGTPSIFQQGTYAPDSGYRWMGSVAMDQAGSIAIGFSLSSSSLHPESHITGRLAGDIPGTMTQGESTIVNGNGSQSGSRGLTRWGDYSMLTVDPSDDCTFFYTNEYLPTTGEFNWSTRIGLFRLPGCGATPTDDFSISVDPSASVDQGAGATATVTTAVTAGSAQAVSLSVSGLPTGATASLSPSSVTAGGASTLTITVGAATPPGTYTVTITGTGASATHTADLALTVTVPVLNDFSIDAAPSTVAVVQGTTGASTISTAITSGVAQTVVLSATGLPTGATATFAPSSVTAGAGSTLTLTANATTPAGSYTITITGTGASATHAVDITLIVTAPVPNDFSISANPIAVSALQGSSTTSTIATAITSGNAETISLSASGLPTGATATFNPSSITSGSSAQLTLSAGAATPPGTYSITVTGTAASASHAVAIDFTVTAPVPNDFSISASPATVTVLQGGNATSTIATAITSGAAQTISLAASGLPSGTSASFSPSSISAGGSATLTLAVGATTPGGIYAITVTGVGASGSHATTVTLTVITTGVINGGFESGFAGWTRTGTTALVGAAHSGSLAALLVSLSRLGLADSAITQTFTAPINGGTLTFWYRLSCHDTIARDWATATVRDNVTAVTTTMLPKTCTHDTSWHRVTTPLAPGHSVTLRLMSHDGDGDLLVGTELQVDDVAVLP